MHASVVYAWGISEAHGHDQEALQMHRLWRDPQRLSPVGQGSEHRAAPRHLSQQHLDQLRLFLRRMETEEIAAVVVELFELVEEDM